MECIILPALVCGLLSINRFHTFHASGMACITCTFRFIPYHFKERKHTYKNRMKTIANSRSSSLAHVHETRFKIKCWHRCGWRWSERNLNLVTSRSRIEITNFNDSTSSNSTCSTWRLASTVFVRNIYRMHLPMWSTRIPEFIDCE